ncbi:MAG: gene transfer agent family protein, partial [Beijerinckiaceae bacterium]
MTANHQRGEVPFTFCSETLKLALTLGALAELEDAVPDGLGGLAARLAGGQLTARDGLAVLAAGFRGAGRPISPDDLGRMIPASDLRLALNTAAALLAASFGGGNSSRPPPPQAAT